MNVRYRRVSGFRRLTTNGRQRATMNALAVITLVVAGSSACGVVTSGGIGGSSVSTAVVATIPLSDYGTDVAVLPDGKRAYVPLQVGSVLGLDLTSRQVSGTIATGGRPYAIALTRDGTRGYVTDLSAVSLFVLDAQNASLTQSISLQSIAQPIKTPAVAVGPDGRWAYVTNATVMDDHLLVIDTAANTIASDHPLNIHPVGVAASPDGRRLYVVGCKFACVDGTLLVMDAASTNVVSSIPLPAAPAGFALSPDGSRAYVSTGLSATVLAINLTTGAVTTIPVDAEPLGIAVDPTGAFVYVTCYGAASVNVIDTRTSAVAARVAVANEPRAIAISPDDRFAYVTHSSPICSVIDLQRITKAPGT